MLTKNGNIFFGKRAPNSSCDWIDIEGRRIAANNWVTPYYINVNNFTVSAGSGSRTPSVNDYCLENAEPLTQISFSRQNPSSYESNFMFKIQAVLKNNTDRNITVREVGVYGFQNYWYFLLVREVLDAPIVISPNKSYLFDITI